MKIRIYSGLSLRKEQSHQILPGADFIGPIKRGDVYKDIQDRVNFILIIDGQFQQVLAVSPGELMDVLQVGIKVYGSSSMGAMRAAELESYGMVGVGRIFSEIRDTPYFRDDYLGQAFTPEGAVVHSLPYMDIKIGCEILRKKNELSEGQMKIILSAYKNLHFSQRNPAALFEILTKKKNSALANIALKIPKLIRSTKNQDALLLVKRVKNDIEKIRKWNQKYFRAETI